MPGDGVAQRLQSERLRFPGLLPREIIVLRNWLKIHEREFDRFDYNIRIGKGVDPGASYDENIRQQAIMNTQKRIDAIGWKANQATLIEVKDRADFSSIGQLIGYNVLWRADHPELPPPKLLIACNRTAGDLNQVASASSVLVELVDADFTELRYVKP